MKKTCKNKIKWKTLHQHHLLVSWDWDQNRMMWPSVMWSVVAPSILISFKLMQNICPQTWLACSDPASDPVSHFPPLPSPPLIHNYDVIVKLHLGRHEDFFIFYLNKLNEVLSCKLSKLVVSDVKNSCQCWLMFEDARPTILIII